MPVIVIVIMIVIMSEKPHFHPALTEKLIRIFRVRQTTVCRPYQQHTAIVLPAEISGTLPCRPGWYTAIIPPPEFSGTNGGYHPVTAQVNVMEKATI
jgi:hypothetical protein